MKCLYKNFCAMLMLLILSGFGFAAGISKKYQIDPTRSVIQVYLDKAGLLETLGHRHLITIRNLQGNIELQGQHKARVGLAVFPKQFLVDDPQERLQATLNYRDRISEKDRGRTRENMLGPHVLDAGQYPVITIDIKLLEQQGEQVVFAVTVRLKGQSFRLEIPGKLRLLEKSLWVNADFRLAHSDLGLKPFSAAGGLIKVAEKLRFVVTVFAVQ